MQNKILIAVIVVIMVLCILALAFNFTIGQKEPKVMLIGYAKYSEKWQQLLNGAKASAKRQGYTFESITCDSANDITKQIELIDDAINKEFDVIIVLPTNLARLQDKLDEARRKSIGVVIIGNNDPLSSYSVASIDYNKVGENLSAYLGNKQNRSIRVFCLVTQEQGSGAAQAFNAFIASTEQDENVTVVARTTVLKGVNVAAATVNDYLEDNSSIDYIVTFEDELSIGAVNGILSYQKSHPTASRMPKVVGLGYSSAAITFVDQGYIEFLQYVNYYAMGYNTVQNAFNGSNTLTEVDVFGVTGENLFDPDIQKVIFPIY